MARKLRIAIDCRIYDPKQGIATALLALAKALSDSGVADQEYTFIVRERLRSWLAPYVYGPGKVVGIPEQAEPEPKPGLVSRLKRTLRQNAVARSLWRKLKNKPPALPASDGYVAAQGFDVVHFATQQGYATELPTIYQPWDLQHLHYPGFFSRDEYERRERLYRGFCSRASVVCVQAEWTKRDVMHQYQIPEERVEVIPWGSVLDAYERPSAEEVRGVVEKLDLPKQVFFYPAATWPHKNHEVIIEALKILKKEDGTEPQVFFTGSSTDHRPVLDKLAQDCGVSAQLHFLGFVTPAELQAIFCSATAMIFPSRFEGFGLPILEAFSAGTAVLAAHATTLPEIGRDGALYFDPDSPRELSELMKTMLGAPELRQELIEKGSRVLSSYSIKDTAARFQALYEKIAANSAREERKVGAAEELS